MNGHWVFMRLAPLVLALLSGSGQAIEPDELLNNPPQLAGEVQLVSGARLVVGDHSARIDQLSRIEDVRGVIQPVSKVEAGKLVAIYLRKSGDNGMARVRRLIILK